MFGLFSQKSLFGKSKKKSAEVALRKEEYFDRLNYIRTASGLKSILADNKNIESNTESEITFRGIMFGASVEEAKLVLDKPDLHVHRDEEVVGHEVLFYTTYIGSLKVIQCLHFINNVFILGQSIVKRPKQDQTKAFIESILMKYNLLSEASLNSSGLEYEFPICDAKHNRIEVQYAYHLTINYISGDPKLLFALDVKKPAKRRRRSIVDEAFREQVVNFV